MKKNNQDKIKRALQEYSDIIQLQENTEKDKKEILKEIILQFDLSPLEEDFLRRHCNT